MLLASAAVKADVNDCIAEDTVDAAPDDGMALAALLDPCGEAEVVDVPAVLGAVAVAGTFDLLFACKESEVACMYCPFTFLFFIEIIASCNCCGCIGCSNGCCCWIQLMLLL